MKAASQSIQRVELKCCRVGNWRVHKGSSSWTWACPELLGCTEMLWWQDGVRRKVERRLHPISRNTGAVPWPLTPVRNVLEEPAATSFSFHPSVVPISQSSHLPDTEVVPCSHPLSPLLFTHWAPGPMLAIETPIKRPQTGKEMDRPPQVVRINVWIGIIQSAWWALRVEKLYPRGHWQQIV